MKNRVAVRKTLDPIEVEEITSLSNYQRIASRAEIVDASVSGFLLIVERKNLLISELKSSLSLANLVGQHVLCFLPQMSLDLDGRIIRADHRGKGRFEVAIEFSADIPDYWRACLIELLPAPGELA